MLCDAWTPEITDHCVQIAKIAEEKINSHARDAIRCRSLGNLCTLPAILIPIILAPSILWLGGSETGSCETLHGPTVVDYVAAVGFVITGGLQAIARHFSYESKMAKHQSFAGRYKSIVSEIYEELAKDRHYRNNPDTFMATMRLRMDYCADGEPMSER